VSHAAALIKTHTSGIVAGCSCSCRCRYIYHFKHRQSSRQLITVEIAAVNAHVLLNARNCYMHIRARTAIQASARDAADKGVVPVHSDLQLQSSK
jgi:hypothetical protein